MSRTLSLIAFLCVGPALAAPPSARGSTRRGRGIEVNTGTVDDHRIRFDALRAEGVDHAIVSLADLTTAHGGVVAIERFRPLVDAFAARA